MISTERQYQNEIDELKAKRDSLLATLELVRDLIDTYVDVVDGPEGQPAANKAMRAVQLIDEAMGA
jgi:hypothetical protein